MATKSQTLSDKARSDLDKVRRLLLSGEEQHYQTARKIMEAYPPGAYLSFDAARLLDGIKQWIENSAAEVKSTKFLKTIVADAKSEAYLLAEDWYDIAIAARALRYGGYFAGARRLYAKAVRKLGDVPPDDANRASVLADYAEFWSYLGYTAKAAAIFDLIPLEQQTGWLLWVKAFTQHQSAFTDLFPPGQAAAPVGSTARYRQALETLKVAQQNLGKKELADSFLLEAACWGGIYRRLQLDDAPMPEQKVARTNAENALAGFRPAPATPPSLAAPVNQYWTWEKERRGMMVRRWVRGIDPHGPEQEEIGQWRDCLVEHFKLNLKAAGLEMKLKGNLPKGSENFADGENGSEDDPGDDD